MDGPPHCRLLLASTFQRNLTISTRKLDLILKQECIPVGCVPPAAVAIGGGGSVSTRHPPRPGPPPWDQVLPPTGPNPPGPGTPPWTEFLTYASENITLPQTSFADGNKETSDGKNSDVSKMTNSIYDIRCFDVCVYYRNVQIR